MIVLPVLSLLSPPVLAELQQADLITPKECSPRYMTDMGLLWMWRYDVSGVIRIQSGKSPGVVLKTVDVLQRHGFEEESRLLGGRQCRPSSVYLCYVAVQYPFNIVLGVSKLWLIAVVCGSEYRPVLSP